MIDYIDDLSYNEYKQLRTACLQYCKVIISCLLEDGLDNCITYKVFSRNYALLYSTPISVPYGKMINGISEKLSFFLQRKYEEVCLNTMSSRALNFQKQYLPNFKDAILFFDKDEIISSIKPDATMIATNKEIVTMLHEYKDIFLKHINDDDDSLVDLNIMDEYPFLCKDERVFILEFTNEHLLKNKLEINDIKKYNVDELINFLFYINTLLHHMELLRLFFAGGMVYMKEEKNIQGRYARIIILARHA